MFQIGGICMTLQTIVSTMNQKDNELINRMRINSDAIVINQTDLISYREMSVNSNIIKWYDFCERGIGLSRNTGMMRAEADIIQFADDDMVFLDDYQDRILAEYEKHPEADVILFSNRCLNKDRMPYEVKKFGRVGRIEAVNFGGARITARRSKLLYNNISFSLLFGGGSTYCAGEDVTFIQDCIKCGLKVYKSPVIISTMKQDTSSWFEGVNEKYFRDKGSLVARNFPQICKLGIYYLAFKNCRGTKYSFFEILGYYRGGVKEFLSQK